MLIGRYSDSRARNEYRPLLRRHYTGFYAKMVIGISRVVILTCDRDIQESGISHPMMKPRSLGQGFTYWKRHSDLVGLKNICYILST